MQQHMTAAQLRKSLEGEGKRSRRPRTINPSVPFEHDEQVALFALAELHTGKWPELGLMYAIPNGGHRHMSVAKELRKEGVKKGVPDVKLPVARGGYFGLYVEMKRIKGETVEHEQKDWHVALRRQGYRVEVARGHAQAWDIIVGYMEQPYTLVDMTALNSSCPEVEDCIISSRTMVGVDEHLALYSNAAPRGKQGVE